MIRRYHQSDLEEVLDVWCQASTVAHPFLHADYVEKVKRDVRDLYLPNAETWVYEEKGKVIGFISMLGNEVGALFVYPGHQSNGVGTLLMDFVTGLFDKLEVEVFKDNPIGRAFYEKYGFSFIKEFMHQESNNKVLRLKYETNMFEPYKQQ